MKKLFRISGNFLAMLLSLLLVLWILLQLPFFQNMLVRQAANRLGRILKTEVQVDAIQIGILNRFSLKGVLIRDQHKDTLAYAGSLKLAITDWFFAQDSVTISYIGIKNVYYRSARTDSIWNDAFLFTTNADKAKKSSGNTRLHWRLDRVEIENVRYEQLDLWRGKSQFGGADRIQIDSRHVNVTVGLIELDRVNLEKPYFREFKTYGLWSKADSTAYWNRIDSIDFLPKPPSVAQTLVINAKEISIREGALQFFNRRKRPSEPGIFDERDIIIYGLSGTLQNVQLLGDTITAKADIKASERSGIKIKRLQTLFKMTPQEMEFAELDLETNQSRLGPYYAMRYPSFEKMEYFIDSVQIEAHLRKSIVSIEDIAIFAPELKNNLQKGVLSGDAWGTVSDFLVQNVNLQTGRSRITGNYKMKGLIDIEKTRIDFITSQTVVDLKDLVIWAPEINDLLATPAGKLDLVKFAGTFSGTPYDFRAKGAFKTKAGDFDTELTMKLLGDNKGYTANILKAKLDGGYLFGVPKLGNLDFKGTVSSNGFSSSSPVALSGSLSEIAYSGYPYSNMEVNGTFMNNQLEAIFSIGDENLKGNLTTLLDFNETLQRYNARGEINFADFRNLGISRDSLLFSGSIDVDFRGNTIDQFLGYARFYNASITTGRKPFSFDSLLVESEQIDSTNKRLRIKTNEITANIEGKFNLSSLQKSIQLFVHQYYPTLIKAPDSLVSNQSFSVEIKTGEVEPFLKLLDPNISGGNFAHVLGSINTETYHISAEADVPKFGYGQSSFFNISLRANGSLENLSVFGSVGNLQLTDKIAFPNAELTIDTERDSTHLRVTTTTAGPLGNASIDANIFSKITGAEIKFNESSFIGNNKKWILEKGGDIIIKDGYIISNGLRIHQDNQSVRLYTSPSSEGNWNNVNIDLESINMGDWLPYIFTEPRLEGLVSGKVTILDPMGKYQVSNDLSLSQFRVNDDSIGTVIINGNYDQQTNSLQAFVNSHNARSDLEGEVKINFNEDVQNQIDTKIKLKSERIRFLRQYLTDVFDDVDGYVTGDLAIRGRLEAPALIGTLALKEASMLVEYTQCRYTIDSAMVELGDNYIDFGSLTVKDQKGRTGQVEGRFFHRFFDSMSFNIRMRTEGMQVLNTQAKDNDLFYGNAIAKATFNLTGPLSNLQIRMTATPTDSSAISIADTESKTTGEADFIVFREYGQEVAALVDTSTSNFHIEMELTANPLCRVDVILDGLTGDIISATGSGNLFIKSGSAEPTVMRGRYIIEKGNYNYTFQSFIRKPFILTGEGNSYIEWNGDPYEANLNVTATYIAKEVSLRDLISNEGSNSILDQNARSYKGDVYVNAKLTGPLSKPNIESDIEFPPGSVMRNNVSALSMLQRIRTDESEKLRQVTYLIVFRSFAPLQQGGSQRNPGADLAVNTISELVSREMGKILTGIIHDITRDQSLTVDLSTNFYNSSQSLGNVNAFNQYDRVNVNFNLNKSYFNNRVVVNLGSDFDLNVRNTAATGFQFLPDVSVEFILTSNRRLRAIIFKRDNLDIVGRRNRAGASISYRKDFEQFFGTKPEDALFIIHKNNTAE